MSKTLLDIVQKILSDMDSDQVNSISDTVESLQVASVVEDTYFEIINGSDWPHLHTIFQLESSGDSDKPSHMIMPSNLQRLDWIKYNKRKSTDTKDKYANVTYLEPKDFIDKVSDRTSSASNVEVITDYTDVSLLIRNDVPPSYWTSFDDEYIVFDSYDSGVDGILQKNKTQAGGYREPTFSLEDDYIPDLPSNAFSYLLAESKSVAFNNLKQSANQKEEQKSRRQRYRLSSDKSRVNRGISYARFGRKK